jgi:energy-coupling factor transport system permease protein
MKMKLFSYNYENTFIHRLSGITKVICFLLLTFAVMYSYDIRVIVGMLIFSILILRVSKVKFSQIRLMVIYVLIFLLINFVITYLFSPGYGSEIYGTSHVLIKMPGRFGITAEQLFYQVTKFTKYASVIPLGIIFLLTTNPSEFASSVSRVGVHYKASYAFSLTLRYFPDIQRTYNDISQAQQARGLEMSSKSKLGQRFKNSLMIVIPLIFSTLDRIEVITNAMDLRGFGKGKRRTWFTSRKMTREDAIALSVSILISLITVAVSVFINHSRFYNPFI